MAALALAAAVAKLAADRPGGFLAVPPGGIEELRALAGTLGDASEDQEALVGFIAVVAPGMRWPLEKAVPMEAPSRSRSIASPMVELLISNLTMGLAQPTAWTLLFDNTHQALESAKDAIEGYSGPMLLVVQDASRNVFGAVCNVSNANNALLAIRPILAARRQLPSRKYAPAQTVMLATRTLIGIGGDPSKSPRLLLNLADPQACRAGALDKTFQPGFLRVDPTSESFSLASLEIFGLGAESDLANRDAVLAMDARLAAGRRRVNRAQFMQDTGVNRELFPSLGGGRFERDGGG